MVWKELNVNKSEKDWEGSSNEIWIRSLKGIAATKDAFLLPFYTRSLYKQKQTNPLSFLSVSKCTVPSATASPGASLSPALNSQPQQEPLRGVIFSASRLQKKRSMIILLKKRFNTYSKVKRFAFFRCLAMSIAVVVCRLSNRDTGEAVHFLTFRVSLVSTRCAHYELSLNTVGRSEVKE